MTVRKLIIRISVVYGILLFVLVLPLGETFASVFSDDPQVIALTATYLKIILIGSIGLNQYNWLSECLTAVGKPFHSMGLNIFGTLCIMLPAMHIGARLQEFSGMLIGLVLGQLIVGIIAIFMSKNRLIDN